MHPAALHSGKRGRTINTALSAVLLCVCCIPTRTAAGHIQAETAPQPNGELPEAVRSALQTVKDFSFSFAEPGFYAVLNHVKTITVIPEESGPARVVEKWTELLERPADYRGLPITIQGVVGHNKTWRFQQPEQEHLGQVWQLELSGVGQPLSATVILSENSSDVPIGALIRVTGYFVMIRQYYGASGQVLQAALLVGHGPTSITRFAKATPANKITNRAAGVIIVALAAGAILWLILRRHSAGQRTDPHTLHATRAAPLNLAEDLARWAAHTPELQDDVDHAKSPREPDDSGIRPD